MTLRTPRQLAALLLLSALGFSTPGDAQPADMTLTMSERWRDEPMPTGFRVEPTELEGPVFADREGRTLYRWPQLKLRNGYTGESSGTPACYDEVLTVTAGLMSPYPAGIVLPELDSRPSCTALWPPVLLADHPGTPVGKWSLVERRDGQQQWAYDEQPLYVSVRDQQPGDTYGGTKRQRNNRPDGDSPAGRIPIGPTPLLPPGFAVKSTTLGRMLTTSGNYSVYAFDGDSASESNCDADCLRRWSPVPAPALAREQGEWSVLERAPGQRQWVYRGQPLYTYRNDSDPWSQQGSDRPGWANVFTQRVPPLPESFTVQRSIAGAVLADARGRTLYTYQCGDDSFHQLACDHPEDTQVYRLAMCGAGDPAKCQRHWPYVVAGADERSVSRAWRIVSIDPLSGRFASPDAEGSLRVWAYRDRPVYTFAGDTAPGQVNGAGTGEWRGKRNGLLAIWLRDDFMEGIQ